MNLKSKKIKNFILTVDGKSSSGKSTAAKLLAKKFKISHLSSGLIYRWAAKKIIENQPKDRVNYLKKNFEKFKLQQLK